MFAAVLIASLLEIEPALPPVEPADRFRFAQDLASTTSEWRFIESHRNWCLDRQRMRLEPAFPWESWHRQSEFCRACWYDLDDAFFYRDDYYPDRRLKALERLRERIGWRAYYAGWMPSTEPYRRLEAELEVGR